MKALWPSSITKHAELWSDIAGFSVSPIAL
jgi:hypothetical protein